MTKNKKIGWLLLLGPICLLIILSMLYPFISMYIGSLASDGSVNSINNTGSSISYVYIIVLGILAFFALFIGLPVGLYLIYKKDNTNTVLKNDLK